MQTVGNVVNAINRLGVTAGLNITASINSTGDGILLTDTGGGSTPMTAAEGELGHGRRFEPAANGQRQHHRRRPMTTSRYFFFQPLQQRFAR